MKISLVAVVLTALISLANTSPLPSDASRGRDKGTGRYLKKTKEKKGKQKQQGTEIPTAPLSYAPSVYADAGSEPPAKSSKGKGRKKEHKQPKKSKQMERLSSKSKKKSKSLPKGQKKGKGSSSGKSKGKPKSSKGKGSTPATPNLGCTSPVADLIQNGVENIITQNPERCCDTGGPTAIFVTHAEPNAATASGLEYFWDRFFAEVDSATQGSGACFVMTGVNQGSATDQSLSAILVKTLEFVSNLPDIPAIMTTDPTEGIDLIDTIRSISNNFALPSIGIFNAGYNNIVIESLVNGLDRLPFVGLLSDSEFGTKAGETALKLLDGEPAIPLCYNPRIGTVDFIGERCASFYAAVTDNAIEPSIGVDCSAESMIEEIVEELVNKSINTVFVHSDCCAVVAEAVAIIKELGRDLIIGCQDIDTSGGTIDYVTAQAIGLEAYASTSWNTFPVIQSQQGKNGRGEQFFPSLQSLVNTAIYSTLLP